MKKFLKLFLGVCFVFVSALSIRAEEYKILVLPDNIQFESTNYLVYPDSSVMFASDIINEIKKGGKIETVSMTEVRDALRKNTKLTLLTKNALKEFKYNYNVPFVDFRAIAHYFSTSKVLVVTSQTDIQNFFLRRTLWDFLNIPGASVIDPAYKLSTYAVLLDVDKEQVLWQNTYYKTISTVENRMIAQSFAPATEQLERIKLYSIYFLSPTIARMVQFNMFPSTDINQGNIVNISDEKSNNLEIPTEENLDFNSKIIVPKRIKTNDYGAVINDL